MLNILWLSDKITGTSAYSRVTAECCTWLVSNGHNVAHVPIGRANRLGGLVEKGVLIMPSGLDLLSEDIILDHYVDFHADMLITLKDVWTFRQIPDMGMNWVPFVPIDHEPLSSLIVSKLNRGTAFRVIAISRFGQRLLRQAGVESAYFPHGVRTDVFKVLDKAECKKTWFLDPDDFTVLFVGKNQSRKMIPRVLRAFKLFRERNPDIKSHMLLWTDVQPSQSVEIEPFTGVADVGVNLLPEIFNLGIQNDIIWPDPKLYRAGLPDWAGEQGNDMVKLYNCANVVISLSGEGFWLPGLEAEATGCPVICADYAAAPEICGAGYTIPVIDYVILNTPGTRYPVCDVDKAAEALAKIANADESKLAKKARAFAERFDWKRVLETYFKPFLEECETELKPLVTKTGVSHW